LHDSYFLEEMTLALAPYIFIILLRINFDINLTEELSSVLEFYIS